jgi:hypothetical protein
VVLVFIVDGVVWLSNVRSECEGLNEEQTATLETALLHAAWEPMDVRAQMRTARQGSNPITWHPTMRVTRG